MDDNVHARKSALNDAPSSMQAEEGDKISYTEEPYPSGNEHECPQVGAEVESSGITKAKASSSARSFKNILFELLNGAVISSSISGAEGPKLDDASDNVSHPLVLFFARAPGQFARRIFGLGVPARFSGIFDGRLREFRWQDRALPRVGKVPAWAAGSL